MTVFPTTSTNVLEVRAGKYDTAQLAREILRRLDGEQMARSKLPGADTSQPRLFHLHTVTNDINILPPKQHITYPGRRPAEPNPEYTAYIDVRDKLCTSLDPLAPLVILPPTRRLLHPPPKSVSTIKPTRRNATAEKNTDSVVLTLPTAHETRPLIRLPQLPAHVGQEWSQSKAWDLEHWLQAAIALDPTEPAVGRKTIYRDDHQRFHLETSVAAMWVPAEDGGTDFKLLITTDVLVDLDTILLPLPDVGDELVGLVLHSLLPSSTTATYMTALDARAHALRRFFDCLSPAPDHPLGFDAQQLQPAEMHCRLYPFQARTLALLLRREGAPIMGELGRIAGDPPGIWSGIELGDEFGKMAYRRITGDLVRLDTYNSDRKGKGKATGHVDDQERHFGLDAAELSVLPTTFDLSSVRGTMLCEEMGLGKTVEAIALTLLYRHPLSNTRTARLAADSPEPEGQEEEAVPVIDLGGGIPGLDRPGILSWLEAERASFEGKTVYDEQAQLNVTEVAATLIITPPPLLQQWVAEIRRHCPTMRVCVYQGWQSLQKAIKRQRDSNIRAVTEALENKKRKSSASFRARTVKKYKMLNGDASVKQEVEEAVVDDPEVEDVSSLEICQRQFVEYVRAHDVVLATYNDLGADLKVALPAPVRSRRSTAKYNLGERPRSPLLMVEWWRVIMDEVQLQGDNSDAANMVSLVPRVNSLAMSGTPARTDIKDLMGSLRFLRVPILPYDTRLWHRLQQPSMRQAFEGIFRELAVRTTKKEVAGEFSLPPQSRFVVPIELSEIELTYYNDTLQRQRDLLRLPEDNGDARPDDWVLDRALFRSSLKTLRQICTHLQVGQMVQAGARGHRLQLGRELVTMGQALERMREEQSQAILLESRNQASMRAMIRKAQLILLDDNEDTRDRRLMAALALYQSAREKVTKQLGPVREHLQKMLDERRETDGDDDSVDGTPARNMSQHDRQKVLAIQSAQSSIREMLIIQHETWFFEGDVHHMLEQEEKEVECYANADAVRKEILSNPLKRANSSVTHLTNTLEKARAVHAVTDLQSSHTDMKGGFLTSDTAEQANELLKIMNGNAELVYSWRTKIIELLSSPIESEAQPEAGTHIEDPEAEYYAQALQAQGEIEAYLIAYAAAVGDRREFIFEDRSTLAELDARMKKQASKDVSNVDHADLQRNTRAAQEARVDMVEEAEGDVVEQAAVLMKERQAFRSARDERDCKRPLRGLIFDMNPILVGEHRPEEKAIAKELVTKLKAFEVSQKMLCDKLEKELELFREVFNRRVRYFAALQEISDSVTAPEFKDLARDTDHAQNQILEIEIKLTRMMVNARYLQYLGTKDHANAEEVRDDCIICMGSSDDTKAVLLDCGHFFCQSCFREYRRSLQARKCPSCREDINERGIKIIKLADDVGEAKPGDSQTAAAEGKDGQTDVDMVAAEDADPAEAQRLRVQADMDKIKTLDLGKRREIAQLDMMGEYGSKIDFLIRHLLWYKAKEPDARHVIFSNWSDSINIVMRALQNNRIKFVSLDQASNKRKNAVEEFKNDTSITVFLLHAERESAGLTLTSCRVVHLLEPVLRHSFELQAIGRVDRLGQDKETTVYCYATRDTVETRILSQGVRNGTSIYLKDEAGDGIVADMQNVASAANKGGDIVNDGNEEELLKLIM